jgi:hypothetical protein
MTEDEKMDKILAELTAIREGQAKLDTALQVHIAASEHAEELSRENNRILKGSNGNEGLVAQVKKNAEAIATFKRIGWTIITPLLAAIGAGIVFLIVQSGG